MSTMNRDRTGPHSSRGQLRGHVGSTRESSARKRDSDQDRLERTTGFEPATLTLAKREENRPSSPLSPLTWSPVRPFVRPARPVRPFRIPVYHRARLMKSATDTQAERSEL
jgi:hypothetical protein